MAPPQHFHGPVCHASARDVHVHHHHHLACPLRAPIAPPPDDPARALHCPQCGGLTWRHTRDCIHCRLDLERWRARRRWAAPAHALAWLVQQLRPARLARLLRRARALDCVTHSKPPPGEPANR